MERYRNGPEDPRPLNHANGDGATPASPPGAVPPAGFSPADAPYMHPQPKLQPLPKPDRPIPGCPVAAPYATWTQNIWQTQPQGNGALPPEGIPASPLMPSANGEAGAPVFAWTQNFWPTAQTNPSGCRTVYAAQPPLMQPAPVFAWTQNYWPQPYEQASAYWPNAAGQLTVYPPVCCAPAAGSFAPVAAPGQPVVRPEPCGYAWQPVPVQTTQYQPVYACPAMAQDTTRPCPPARNQNEQPPEQEQTARYQPVQRQPEAPCCQPAMRQPVPPRDSWRTIPERTMLYRPARRNHGDSRPERINSRAGEKTKREWQPVKGQAYVYPERVASQPTRQSPLEPSTPFRTEAVNVEPRFSPAAQTAPAEMLLQTNMPQQNHQQSNGEVPSPSNLAPARVPETALTPDTSLVNPGYEENGNTFNRRRTDTPAETVSSSAPIPDAASAATPSGEPVSREESRTRFDGATSSRWAIRMAPLPSGGAAVPSSAASPGYIRTQAETPSARSVPVAEQAGRTAAINSTGRSDRYQTPQAAASAPNQSVDEPQERSADRLPRPDLPLLRETSAENHPGKRLGVRGLKWIAAVAVVVALTMAGVQSGLLGRFSELITSAPVPMEGSQTVPAWPTDLPLPETVQPLGTARLVSATVSPDETTAPANLTFTLTTDSAATAVRLVTEKGDMLRTTTSSTPQGDGLVWHISAQLANPYSGVVRIFLCDTAGAWAEGSVSCAVKVQ